MGDDQRGSRASRPPRLKPSSPQTGAKQSGLPGALPFSIGPRRLSWASRFQLQTGDCAIPPPNPRRSHGAAGDDPAPAYNQFIQSDKVRVIDENGENLGVMYTREAIEQAARSRPRPGRGLPQRRSAGVQVPRCRQVPLRGAEEGQPRAQVAEDAGDQGDQDASEHRRPRLRDEDEGGAGSSRKATR